MVIRIATSNNFNGTAAEWSRVKAWQAKRPNDRFFVNMNVLTPKLLSVNRHKVPVVVTINPGLVVSEKLVQRFLKIKPKLAAFVRVKYSAGTFGADQQTLIYRLRSLGYQVVVTMQRFKRRAAMDRFGSELDYTFHREHNDFRLRLRLRQPIEQFTDAIGAHICDRSGKGCPSCGLCAKFGGKQEGADVASLNLSTSGVCTFNCPDCFAKMNQFRTRGRIAYDRILKNSKQKGKV